MKVEKVWDRRSRKKKQRENAGKETCEREGEKKEAETGRQGEKEGNERGERRCRAEKKESEKQKI